jgi:hypothetical protein
MRTARSHESAEGRAGPPSRPIGLVEVAPYHQVSDPESRWRPHSRCEERDGVG